MLQLFKRKKTEQEIIAEIHNEFDTAQDRLLDEADKLLLEMNIPTETSIEKKAEKLERLGFINSELVKQAKSLKDNREKQEIKLVQTKEQAELIRYYKQTYPFQKFLTESELERICEKYKLIFAPVANYIKDVPEKNLQEIESANPLLTNDVVKSFSKITKITFFDEHTNEYKEYVKNKIKNHKFYTKTISEWDIRDLCTDFVGDRGKRWYFNTAELSHCDVSGLFIAAPPSHFNLKGLSQKNKYSFMNITITEVNDPIVFRYCRGGIQVLSKWGLEGQDEALVNEKLN